VSSTDGATAKFIGALVKYGFNAASDFVSLAPGASVDVTHECKIFIVYHIGYLLFYRSTVSAAYNFTEVGDYKVDVGNVFHYQEEDGTAAPITANITNQYTAKLSGSLVSSIVTKRSKILNKRASFNGCGIPQMAAINTALDTATTYVADAVTYLTALSSASQRYTTWFGEVPPSV
jgi:peptidyl-Lys metalloendopeptidase